MRDIMMSSSLMHLFMLSSGLLHVIISSGLRIFEQHVKSSRHASIVQVRTNEFIQPCSWLHGLTYECAQYKYKVLQESRHVHTHTAHPMKLLARSRA